jgi:hypothetical protein
MSCIPGSCDSNCIAFKHSSGPDNCDPCMDLGGPISICDITDDLDNLFHSIGPNLSRRGHEDYRCFYIQNASTSDTLRNVIIYLDGPAKISGAIHSIGVKLQDEIQEVIVTGTYPPKEGEYMDITVPNYTPSFKVYFDPNVTKWVGNFQTAIRGVEGLPEVVVTVGINDKVGAPTSVHFTVNFGGHDSRNKGHKGTQDHKRWMQAARRQIDIMSIVSTYSNVTVIPTAAQDGSPVNTVAQIIPNEITPPSGISFNYFYRGNPVRIGDLRPDEFVPIWIKRTLPFPDPSFGNLARPGQMAKLLDNFKIRVDATYP